jgi:transposase-like protein
MADEIKVHANEQGNVTIVCSQCGNYKVPDVHSYRAAGHSSRVAVKCNKCGNKFTAFVNFRRFYRKETRLPGVITAVDLSDIRTAADATQVTGITVENISRSGVGFTINGPFPVSQGDTLYVKFTLDDGRKSVVNKKIVIRRIIDTYIAAEFITRKDEKDTDLALYLKPGNV